MEKELERFEQFSYSIFEISRFWHQLTSREMEKHNLKGAHTLYMLNLYNYPEGISARELGRMCGRDKADVSRMMGSLEERELVIKEGSYQRMYGGVYKLTEQGRRVTEDVRSRVKLVVDIVGRDMPEDARSVFYMALTRITENVRKLSEEGIPEV